MLFQTAGIETAPWIPPLVAFVISFITSIGGVSGAFLLLPFQMSFLGYTHPSVSATNQLFNVVAIPSGVYRYYKEGRMVWPLTWIVIIGTLPGVFMGAFIRVAWLPDPKNFKAFAAVILLYIGIRILRDITRNNYNAPDNDIKEKGLREKIHRHNEASPDRNYAANENDSPVKVTQFNFKRLIYTFYDESFDVSFWGIAALSFIVGIAGGIYGIGGGAIIAPFFVSFFGLSVYTIAGAALMGTFVTSAAGVIFYQAIAPYYPDMSVAPDWQLGVLFGIGGMAGMYLGARCQKYVPAKAIKWLLTGIIIFTALKYVAEFIGY